MAKGKYEYWLTDDGLLLLRSWARNGLTDEQIAKNMGIAPKTLYRWKEKYCQICQSLKKGKEVVDVEVENALLKRALGCTVSETRTEIASGETKIVTITKEVPPDTTAQIFWLKNRQPEKWRDKRDIDANVNAEINAHNPFKDLTTDELRKLIKDE